MLLNILIFNFSWFTLIFTGNTFVLLVLLVLLAQFLRNTNKQQEFHLFIIVSLIGISVDSLLMQANVFLFANSGTFIPIWLMVVWLAFATTINNSLRFFAGKPLLQLICGAIIPPLNYLAGGKLGAVSFTYSPVITFFILSAVWAPLLVFIFHCQRVTQIKEQQYD